MRAPRFKKNPFYERSIKRSPHAKKAIASAGGFSDYANFWHVVTSDVIVATPQMIERLERIAIYIGFPIDEIFLDRPQPIVSTKSDVDARQVAR